MVELLKSVPCILVVNFLIKHTTTFASAVNHNVVYYCTHTHTHTHRHTHTHSLTPPSLSPSFFPPQRFGFTVLCPDDIPVPSGALDLYRSSDYWILSASTVHHNGQENRVAFNLETVGVGQSIGCHVNRDGELRYSLNGVDQGVAWKGLPTDKPMWGFADIYGLARKIKSEFLFGEWTRMGWACPKRSGCVV